MTTDIHDLKTDDESWEFLHSLLVGTYLEGECYAFALAISRALRWPMLGLIDNDVIEHACVRCPDGRLLDARGFITEDEFGSRFVRPPFDIREITEKELYDTRPIFDGSIEMAERVAEVLWPELPWKNTYAMRVTAFADELEVLSRKHRLWIRGSVPTMPPLLAKGQDDEAGYKLRHTADGLTFTIERYFAT